MKRGWTWTFRVMGAGALLLFIAWQIDQARLNALADAEFKKQQEARRPLTMAEMEQIGVELREGYRRTVKERSGEALCAGLKIGMTLEDVAAVLGKGHDPNFADSPIQEAGPTIQARYGVPGDASHDVLADFIDRKLYAAKIISKSADSFGASLPGGSK